MSGFPTRSLRSALGPTYRDARPVENPEIELGAEQLELLLQMATGVNLVAARASLVAEWNGGTSTFDVLHQEETWNVDHSQAHPELDRTSAGVYTYQFASSYLDVSGIAVNTVAVAARCSPSQDGGGCTAEAWVDSADATMVHVETKDGGTAADVRFWLEVL